MFKKVMRRQAWSESTSTLSPRSTLNCSYLLLLLLFPALGLTQHSSANKEGSGGHATEGRDSAGGKDKAKQEHPEAPDPAIGMQDERGGRGG